MCWVQAGPLAGEGQQQRLRCCSAAGLRRASLGRASHGSVAKPFPIRCSLSSPSLTILFAVLLKLLCSAPAPHPTPAVAEAAVGRDAVMRAVASAVLQADALEHALLAALPLGPQGAAGGVSLPDLFTGELEVGGWGAVQGQYGHLYLPHLYRPKLHCQGFASEGMIRAI